MKGFLICLLFACCFAQSQTINLGLGLTLNYQIGMISGDLVINSFYTLTGVNAWAGFGFSNYFDPNAGLYGMTLADFVVCTFPAGCVDDYNPQPKETMPVGDVSLGGKMNIISTNVTRVGTTTTYFWSRLLNTNDVPFDNSIILTGPQHVIFAHGTSDTFGYHGASNRNYGQVDFALGTFVVGSDSSVEIA